MNKEDFIKACTNSGYCYEETAKEYAEKHNTVSEKDFEEVFRKQEQMPIGVHTPYGQWRATFDDRNTTRHYMCGDEPI